MIKKLFSKKTIDVNSIKHGDVIEFKNNKHTLFGIVRYIYNRYKVFVLTEHGYKVIQFADIIRKLDCPYY